MKKSQEYVSRGFAPQPPPEEEEATASSYTYTPPQAHPPQDLPRDYGMRGAVGAYEVSPLSKALPGFFKELERHQHENGDSALIAQVLDTMLGQACALVETFSFEDGTLTLLLAPNADRFAFSRRWESRLRQALFSHFGHISLRIQKTTSRA